MEKSQFFAEKLSSIKSRLNQSHLLIVSKTRSEEDIIQYYNLGHRDFGENRVQELLEKAENLREICPEIRWHMIGHLQSNKVNQLFTVPNLWAIHSVDDEELLQKLIKSEHRLNQEVRVFLQFNTSKEEEKSGFENYDDLLKAAKLIPLGSKIKLHGLMTMGTLRTESFEQEAKRCFKELNSLKFRLETELGLNLESSMGMSQDYEIALQEKSDWIRLGTMMFV
jgi:pyridoxal phosphate enzyme (YggS family)